MQSDPDSWFCELHGTIIGSYCNCQSQIYYDGEYHYDNSYYVTLPDRFPDAGLWFGITRWWGELIYSTMNTYYGRYFIGEDEYNKGNSLFVSGSNTHINHSTPHHSCSPGAMLAWETRGGFTKCEPQSGKKYSFQGWAWDNVSGVAYKLLSDELITEEDEGGNTSCVWADNWQETNVGTPEILNIATTTFPYDFNWTSILLHGKDSNQNEYENEVIYINSDGFFIRNASGGTYDLGNYDRAYFTQYEFTENL